MPTANIQMKITANNYAVLDHESIGSLLSLDLTKALASGTGADQINQIFSDKRTLAASGTEDLDLSGALVNALGNSVAFAKVKALVIRASSANTNDVEVGGAASNGFTSFFGAGTHKVKVKPGGVFIITAPNAAGLAVTAGTADLLKIANGGAGSGVTFDIVFLGVE